MRKFIPLCVAVLVLLSGQLSFANNKNFEKVEKCLLYYKQSRGPSGIGYINLRRVAELTVHKDSVDIFYSIGLIKILGVNGSAKEAIEKAFIRCSGGTSQP